MERAALTVVIPTLNGAERLPETLASIASQRVEGAVQVVVVDDGSSDATRKTVSAASLPWGQPLVLFHPAPRGRAAACNRGIEAATAPIVVILDDDMTLQGGALEAHRRFHASSPGSAAIGRVLQSPAGPRTCFERFLVREETNRERQLLDRRTDVPFALCLTGHFSSPREALTRAGGFDERITRYGLEDIELAYRLHEGRTRIAYLPEAVARHRAYMTDLDRYLDRHFDVGVVARELAARYTEGPFREYLRVDGPKSLGLLRDPAGLTALRLANRLLLRRFFRRALGSRPGTAFLRGTLAAAARLQFDRLAHFGYHVARDLRYFQGFFGEGR